MVNWVLNFEKQVQYRGQNTAVIYNGDRYSYDELNRDASGFANWVDDIDADRVALYMPNRYAFFVAQLGALKAGAAGVPVNYMFGEEMIEYVLNDSDAEVVVTGAEDAETIAEVAPNTAVEETVIVGDTAHDTTTLEDIHDETPDRFDTVPQQDDDLFNLMYTSGTTGKPKGVYRTHRNMEAQILRTSHLWKVTPMQTWLCAGPAYHSTGLEGSALAMFLEGATVLLQQWDIEQFYANVDKYRPDVAYLAGAMINDLYETTPDEAYNLDSLQTFFTGGGPMDPEKCEAIEERYDVVVSNRMGSTETGLMLAYAVGDPYRFSPREETPISPVPNSPGKGLKHGIEVRVVDVDSNERAEQGELQARGESLFEKYLNKPEKTSEVFTDDGWYHTGDIVKLDEEGYVHFVDRMDNMIVTGGENVSPKKVERVVDDHPEVAESAVFPVPDDHWGQRVCLALVTASDSLSEADILEYCREARELNSYEVPKDVFVRDSLPKTATGTIKRNDLTDEYGA